MHTVSDGRRCNITCIPKAQAALILTPGMPFLNSAKRVVDISNCAHPNSLLSVVRNKYILKPPPQRPVRFLMPWMGPLPQARAFPCGRRISKDATAPRLDSVTKPSRCGSLVGLLCFFSHFWISHVCRCRFIQPKVIIALFTAVFYRSVSILVSVFSVPVIPATCSDATLCHPSK